MHAPCRRGSRSQGTNIAGDSDDDGTASTASMTDLSSDDGSGDDNDNESDGEDTEPRIYTRTDPRHWKCYKNGEAGRTVDPIPFMGGNEEFKPDITDAQGKDLMNENGDICFYKVLEHCLPRFGPNDDQTLFNWQSVRMRN